MDKHARLLELGRLRQESRWPGYKCIGDYHGGVYECDFVSPYTRSACNVDAELMILLQDWSSDEVLSGPYLHGRCTAGHDPCRVTNKRLKELLRAHFGLELEDVYATNVFPFVKLGAMNRSIAMRDLVRAAREFALPQIEIIGPRLAVCLGKAAFDAVALAAGHVAPSRWRRRSRPRSRSAGRWCGARRTRGSLAPWPEIEPELIKSRETGPVWRPRLTAREAVVSRRAPASGISRRQRPVQLHHVRRRRLA
jgi:uracil-DNA glycosylase